MLKATFHQALLLASVAVGSASASLAQTTPALPTLPPTPARAYRDAAQLYRAATAFQTGDPLVFSYVSRDPLLQKKIDLNIGETNPVEALKKVAALAGLGVVVDKGVSSDRAIKLRGSQFVVQDALNAIASVDNLRWRLQKVNGKGQIRISRGARAASLSLNQVGPAFAGTPFVFNQSGKRYQTQIDNAIRQSFPQFITTPGIWGFGAALPDVKVKVDTRDADARDVLKDILAQANLPYALEDDVPTGQKHSFTFENVPISMALDIITTSLGIGWQAEAQSQAPTSGANATSGAPAAPPPLVRVGKKYANPLGSTRYRAFGVGTPLTPPRIYRPAEAQTPPKPEAPVKAEEPKTP